MKPLMEAMVEWYHERYLDPRVWDELRPKLHPILIPESSTLELSHNEPPPPALEYLVCFTIATNLYCQSNK